MSIVFDWFMLLAASALITLAGCGGGGGGGGASTFSLSGTISAPENVVIDSDVNDPDETYAPNDTIAQAQPIGNPVAVGGYANVAGAGAPGRSSGDGDPDDFFRVALNSRDRIVLAIGDAAAGDLDLAIYDGSGELVGVSMGDGATESFLVEDAGNYFVGVTAVRGASNYILTIGPDPGGTLPDVLSSEHDFVAGQAIVRFTEAPRTDIQRRTPAQRAASLGMDLQAGAEGRPVLLSFDIDHGKEEVFRALAIDTPSSSDRPARPALQRKHDTLRAIKALRQRPDVRSASPNYIVRHYATIPADTYFHLQWHYPLISLPEAWDITTGSGDVVVAVVDTGVLMGHPDLAGRLTDNGYDFISDPAISGDGDGIDPDPDDPGDRISETTTSSFHGTHVAGTVAAASNNSRGVAGVAWNTRIMPIRALGRGGGTLMDVMEGVRYAAGEPNDSGVVPAQPAAIINMSFGGGGFSQAAQELFTQVRNKGIILVAAAGNESTSAPTYPAAYDGVIAVSAVDINANPASYSNRGPHIDVAAPGGETDKVLSTCGNDASGGIQFNYCYYVGTSMASPQVAGVVALMKALHPTLTPDELDGYLQGGDITIDLGPPGRDDRYGHGLIDAYKAVLTARQAPIATTFLNITPNTLNFGTSVTSATLTVSKIGDDDLVVSGFTGDVPWLQISAGNVDGQGLGTYIVQVDRRQLGNGIYTADITFTLDPADTRVIPVRLQVNTATGPPDAGLHYVLLMNADTLELEQQVAARADNGSYAYAFTGVSPGSYWIFAGSDRDNDTYINNPGEAFGAYRTLGQITTVVADRNRTGLNFATDLNIFLLDAARSGQSADDRPLIQRIR